MLAEEKQLHVVEFRKENDSFPILLASPSVCRKSEEIKSNEVMDYTQVCISILKVNIKGKPGKVK